MSLQFKLGMIFGLIALVGVSLLVFKVVVKLGVVFMAIGVGFVLWYAAKFLFFGKKK